MPSVTSNDILKERDRKRVADFIDAHAGIQLPASKHTLVETRLRKRQRILGFDTLTQYIDFALSNTHGNDEQLHFVDALTTNKTDFYREPSHFEFMRRYMPKLPEAQLSNVKIWSAGCSSGEEPYTLSIEMLEMQQLLRNLRFTIDATDISVSCLQTCKTAIYSHDKISPIALYLRKKYVLRGRDKTDERVQMSAELRQHINFDFFNLLTGDYQAKQQKYDLIFCRNVMIYFNDKDRAKLSEYFFNSLKSGGILFIGHSETLLDPQHYFDRVQPTIYQKRKTR